MRLISIGKWMAKKTKINGLHETPVLIKPISQLISIGSCCFRFRISYWTKNKRKEKKMELNCINSIQQIKFGIRVIWSEIFGINMYAHSWVRLLLCHVIFPFFVATNVVGFGQRVSLANPKKQLLDFLLWNVWNVDLFWIYRFIFMPD